MKYFSLTGSYEGGVKFRGKWVHVVNLNHVDKTNWQRVMTGDMTKAMALCLLQPPVSAKIYEKATK